MWLVRMKMLIFITNLIESFNRRFHYVSYLMYQIFILRSGSCFYKLFSKFSYCFNLSILFECSYRQRVLTTKQARIILMLQHQILHQIPVIQVVTFHRKRGYTTTTRKTMDQPLKYDSIPNVPSAVLSYRKVSFNPRASCFNWNCMEANCMLNSSQTFGYQCYINLL